MTAMISATKSPIPRMAIPADVVRVRRGDVPSFFGTAERHDVPQQDVDGRAFARLLFRQET